MEQPNKSMISWPVVIITLIVFWPIGCVLLAINCFVGEGRFKARGRVLTVIAGFFYIMFVAGFGMYSEVEFMPFVFTQAVILGLGVLSTKSARKNLKLAKEYEITREEMIQSNQQDTFSANEFEYNDLDEDVEVITVQCKNCGATNVFVEGRKNKCEYCDSILSEEYKITK